jgi:hypothetical protein
MTTRFVPQKGLLKTWATCIFTAGYQAKPQTGIGEKKPYTFLICQKQKNKNKKKRKKVGTARHEGTHGVYVVYLKSVII